MNFEMQLLFVNKTMADVEGSKDSNSERSAEASCDHVKDSCTDESHNEPSTDAELDDILEGTLK